MAESEKGLVGKVNQALQDLDVMTSPQTSDQGWSRIHVEVMDGDIFDRRVIRAKSAQDVEQDIEIKTDPLGVVQQVQLITTAPTSEGQIIGIGTLKRDQSPEFRVAGREDSALTGPEALHEIKRMLLSPRTIRANPQIR